MTVTRSLAPASWIAGVQRERWLSLDPHLDGTGEDVADLFARVHVPARLDAGRDLREHLHDLAAGNRGGAALELGALERPRQRIGGSGVGRHDRPPE
jgi:hypothetical protein